MVLLRISLFGKFCVWCDERLLAGIDAGKVQQLFCYLLLHRDRPHPREKLASLFWDNTSTAQSKKYLRQTLWQLQSSLEEAGGSGLPQAAAIILADPEWVQINTTPHLWLDVAAFEEIFRLSQGTPGRDLSAAAAQKLQEAIRLYQGNLLEGWYQDWCLYERERFLHMYLDMLDKLMGYCEARQDYENGLLYGDLILRHDRARERTHRRLMRLYYQAGNRTEALRQFERCLTALQEELGVTPARSTLSLHAQIREDNLPLAAAAAPPAAAESDPILPTASLPDAISRLQQMRATLSDLQQQVDYCLEACRHALQE